MLYDTHCHLNMIRTPAEGYYDFHPANDNEIAGFIERAKVSGITNIMQAGTFTTEIEREIEICKKFSSNDISILCSLANHPENVKETGIVSAIDLIRIVKQNDNSKYIKAIGETGLDSHRTENMDFWKEQVASFENHIEAGVELNLPIIVHAYGQEALDKCIDMATQIAKKNTDFKYVFHCFDGDYEKAKKIVDNGGIISISGIITFKRNEHTREVARKIPLEYLVLETDAPFLAPAPVRGQPNETSYIKYTAEFTSQFIGIDYDTFCEITTENGIKFFGK